MRIVFAGGIHQSDGLAPQECRSGYNFDLSITDASFRPRASFDLKDTAPLAGTIAGLIQLIDKDDTATTLVFEDDGATPTLNLWDGSTFTSKRTNNLAVGSKLRGMTWGLDDYSIITDISKLTPMLKWDGSTCTRLKTGLLSGTSKSVTSLTRSGATATATVTAHGYSNGDLVTIAGANETEYNGEFEISNVAANTFDYTVSGSPASPATGTITAEKGQELYAKYGLIHQGRAWLFNVKTSTDTPHLMVASAFENVESYDTSQRAITGTFSTGLEAFYMTSPDVRGINGAFIHQDQIVISTQGGRLFKLTGTDANDYAWVPYYHGSAATGDESFANIGNDAVFMREGGNIESLTATEQAGDVAVDDISRWIPDKVKDLTGCQIVYDKTNQKVLFWTGTEILVLFKDLLYASEFSPWSVYKTDHSCNFSTSAVMYLRRPGATTYSVYFGDDSGNIYDLNGTGSGDGGTTQIVSNRVSGLITDPERKKQPLIGRVHYRRVGECDLSLKFNWADNYHISSATIPLKGPTATGEGIYWGGEWYWGGDYYWNSGFIAETQPARQSFSPSGKGMGYTLTLSVNTNISFQVDSIEL